MKQAAYLKKIMWLYEGLEFEYYVASKLWGLGYEALKLPIDFGFDLLVYNQKEKLLGSGSPAPIEMDEPFVIQVKSGKAHEVPDKELSWAGRTKSKRASFIFSKFDIENIRSIDSAFVICVCYDDTIPKEVVGSFWLNSYQFSELYRNEKRYFEKQRQEENEKEKYVLSVEFQVCIDAKEDLKALLEECLAQSQEKAVQEKLMRVLERLKKWSIVYENNKLRVTLPFHDKPALSDLLCEDQLNISKMNSSSKAFSQWQCKHGRRLLKNNNASESIKERILKCEQSCQFEPNPDLCTLSFR